MTTSDVETAEMQPWQRVKAAYRAGYRTLGYFGLVSIFGAQLYGFRYDPGASPSNYAFDLLLYALFIVPHLVMTRAWFKQAVWGQPSGSARERRVYIAVSVVTWLVVWFCQRPLSGPSLVPAWQEVTAFFGTLGFLLCVVLFFQGMTFEMLDGLLGVEGSQGTYSHGSETPLFTSGPYASVRHPMYRAALLASLSSIVMHPNAAQLFWAVLISMTFVAYIPIEESQLLAARGEDYRQYQLRTPYRLLRGIW